MNVQTLVVIAALWLPAAAFAQDLTSFRVLATNKTSTMQKELSEAAEAGFRSGSRAAADEAT